MKSRTSWKAKRDRPQEREIKPTPKGRMLIPTVRDVDALVRKVKRGTVTTISAIRERLARDARADYACPLCTGIFLRIVAEAAEEEAREGKADIAPWWRVLKPDGTLHEKLPGGAAEQAARLGREGHQLLPGRGKKPPKVAGFEASLAAL